MKTWTFWERLLSILQTIAIVAGLILIFLTWKTVVHQEAKDSADIIFKFNDYFDQQKYEGLIDALDTDNIHVPIVNGVRGHRTKYSETLVYSYMSLIEMLDDLYNHKLIKREMIFQNFSDNIENEYKNDDIQYLIKRDRKEDPTFWTGFQHIAEEFKK